LVIGDVTVRAGFAVLVLIAAAHRDPDEYPDPDRYDLDRGTARHLAFAAGPHFCMGADMARMEARIFVQRFATRLRDPELVAESLEYRPNVSVRGPLHMRVAATVEPA
jgi:cytochrome P450